MTFEINRSLVVGFLELLQDEEFQGCLQGITTTAQVFFQHLRQSQHPSACNIVHLMQEKERKRTRPLQKGVFYKKKDAEEDPVLQELGSEQVRQILRLALAVNAYRLKDKRIADAFNNLFAHDRVCLPMSYINGGQFLQHVLKVSAKNNKNPSSASPASIDVPLSTPTPFQTLLFLHALAFVETEIQSKHMKVRRNNKNGNTIGLAVQRICAGFTALTKEVAGMTLQKAVAPYILFDRNSGMFKTLARREQGYAPQSQLQTLPCAGQTPLHGPEGVDGEAYNRGPEEDIAWRYVAYLLFDSIATACGNQLLYNRGVETWGFMEQFAVPHANDAAMQTDTTSLPTLCAQFPDAVLSALGVTRPTQHGATPVVVLDENGDDIRTAAPLFANKKVLYQRGETTPSGDLGADARNTRSLLRVAESQRFTESVAAEIELGEPPKKRAKTEPEALARNEDIHAPAAKADLSEEAVSAMATLQKEMRGVFDMYDCDFRELVEAHELGCGVSLQNSAQLVLCDPPYNIRRVRHNANSEYDRFGNKDQADLIDEIAIVLQPGGHAHTFCATEDLSTITNLVRAHKTEVEMESTGSVTDAAPQRAEEDVGDTTDLLHQQHKQHHLASNLSERTFHLDANLVHYTRARGNYCQDPRARNVGFISMVEVAVHFWKRGVPRQVMLNMVQYDTPHRYVPATQPGWVNVVDNIPRPDPDEVVYDTQTGRSRRLKMRAEQKSVRWMMDIIARMTRPGDLVVDFTAGTFPVMKACMQLPQHRRFIGCDKDHHCVAAASPSVVFTFAKQIWNPSSDIEGNASVKEAARIFMEAFSASQAFQRRKLWVAPKGLPHMQAVPAHIMSYLVTLHADTGLGASFRRIPPDLWPAKWATRFREADVAALRAAEAVALGVRVQPSTIMHDNAGLGLFTTKSFGARECIGYYYGALVYRSLADEGITCQKQYGEGPLAVTPERFQDRAMDTCFRVKDDNDQEHPVWIVPAPFCVTQYINDGRYLPEDKEINSSTPTRRRNNVEIVCSDIHSVQDLRMCNVIMVVSRRNITAGEELFTDYGSEYEFR